MASRRSSRSERPALAQGWTLWPQVLVRGAGFPFTLVHESLRDGSAGLRRLARDERFREAVTWQNRAAVVDGLDSLLRKPEGATDSKTRKKELLVVRYLQRYATKNDTIGFFGPVGWGRWGDAGQVTPGQTLLSARAVFLEPWAARVLADTFAARPALEGAAPVRLPGDVGLHGPWLVTPQGSQRVSREVAALLRRLQQEGPLPAKRLVGRGGEPAWALLRTLASQQVVRWSFPVAICHEPLASVRKAVEASRDDEAKAQLRAVVSALEELRARCVAPASLASGPDSGQGAAGGAVGRDTQVGAALSRLEAAFTAATAHAPKRHEGRTYGGRGLVYEECRRDVSVVLSPAMRARVAEPLSVLLQVARWYSFDVAKGLLAQSNRALEKLGDGVPLHVLWAETAGLFEGEPPRVLAPTLKRLRERLGALWAGRPTLEVEEARAFVTRRFAAPCPGWPGARHHAPDLMWAAPSAEAMLRGEGTPLLGELHPGVTPFTTLSVLAHAAERPALERQWREDLGEEGVSPVPWEDFARSSQDARLSRRHWHLDLGYEFESERPPGRVLRAADFVVKRVKGRPVVVHRARGLRFHLMQVFERRVKLLAATHFSLGDGEAVGPRRTLGGLVVQRAHWRFGREALAWLDEVEGRQERARAFCAAHHLPQHVFVRSPEEVKPVYLDWHQPLLLEMVARLARQADALSLSEMLPGPDELWLRDAAGAPHVCELRCLAVDPEPWIPQALS